MAFVSQRIDDVDKHFSISGSRGSNETRAHLLVRDKEVSLVAKQHVRAEVVTAESRFFHTEMVAYLDNGVAGEIVFVAASEQSGRLVPLQDGLKLEVDRERLASLMDRMQGSYTLVLRNLCLIFDLALGEMRERDTEVADLQLPQDVIGPKPEDTSLDTLAAVAQKREVAYSAYRTSLLRLKSGLAPCGVFPRKYRDTEFEPRLLSTDALNKINAPSA